MKYQTKKIKCKKCKKDYVIESDSEIKDPGLCSGCKKDASNYKRNGE